MKKLIFLSVLSLFSMNYKQSVASTLQEASESLGHELVRLGKIEPFSKQEEKEVDVELIEKVQAQRGELEKEHRRGNLELSEYVHQDEIFANKIPVVRIEQKDMSENALHGRIILLANIVLKELLQISAEQCLDITAKNKKEAPAFTVSDVKIESIETGPFWGQYKPNTKCFNFTKIKTERSKGRTSFNFEASVLGFVVGCKITSSYRLYGKEINAQLFQNGRNSCPNDLYHYS